MQSKTSFFNLALFKKNISRTWIVGLLYFIILLILIPIMLIIDLANFDQDIYGKGYTKTLLLLNHIAYMPTSMWGITIAIIVTAITFWYLFFKRDNYMMHSFPVSRKSLYFTGLISSITVTIVPVILIACITSIVAAVEKTYAFDAIWFWALTVCVSTLLFIGIAMFSLMASGQIVTSIVFYLIFNYLFLMMEVAFKIAASILMFGMSDAMSTIAYTPFTPVCFIGENCLVNVLESYDSMGNIKSFTYTLPGMKYLIIYAIVAVVFITISYILYTHKKLETVQDFIAVPFLKPVFTVGMSFFISMVAGALVAGMVDALKIQYYNTRYAIAIVSTLIIGCIVFYATQMLIEKTFRVFSSKKFGFLMGYSLAAFAVLLCMRFDVFKVENKVPAAEDIAWVGISSDYTMVFSNPEDINSIRELHHDFLADKKELRDVNRLFDDVDGSIFTIKYKLKNGKYVQRTYSVVDTNSDKVTATYLAACEPIVDYLNNPTRIKEHVIGNIWDDCNVTSLQFSQYIYSEKDNDYFANFADFDDLKESEQIEKNNRIYAAFLKDIDDGNIFTTTFGDRYNDKELQKIQLFNDFSFTIESDNTPYFSDEQTYWDWQNENEEPSYQQDIYAQLTTECKHTLKALKDEGFYTEDSELVTNYEYNKVMGYDESEDAIYE